MKMKIIALLLMAGIVCAAPGDADTSFGTNGISTLSNGQFYSVMENGSGSLYAVGQQNSQVCIAKYDNNGNLDTSFNSPNGYIALGNYINGPAYGLLDSSGGIYIVGVATSSLIKVLKIKADGTGLDTSFHSPNGYYDASLAAAGIQSHFLQGAVMDSTNRILVYGGGDDFAKVSPLLVCIKTDGTGIDTSFGNDGIILETGITDSNFFNAQWEGFAVDTSGPNRFLLTGWAQGQGSFDVTHAIVAEYSTVGSIINIDGDVQSVMAENEVYKGIWVYSFSAFSSQDSYGHSIFTDDNGYAFVAGKAKNSSGSDIVYIARLSDLNLSLDISFGDAGIMTLFPSNGYVKGILEDINDNIYILGNYLSSFDTHSGEFMVKLTLSEVLDSSFGLGGVESNFNSSSVGMESHAFILQSGVSPVYVGTDNSSQAVIGRLKVLNQGQLDIYFGSSGQRTLNGIAGFSSGTAQAMHIASDGSIFVVSQNGTNAELAKLTSGHVADGAFNGGSKVTFAISSDTRFVGQTVGGDIVMCGGDGASGSDAAWLRKVDASGGSYPMFNVTDVIDKVFKVVEQSTGRLVVAGIEDGVATLIAYSPVNGAVDTSFGGVGTGRYTVAGVTNPIVDIAVVDGVDELLIAYVDGSSNAQVKKLMPNATAEVSGFTFGTAIGSVVAADQLKMRLLSGGKIAVVARDGSSNFVAHRYAADGSDDVGPVTVNVANLNKLADVLPLSDGKFAVLGGDSSSNMVLARLSSSFALDTSFETSGISVIDASVMTNFFAVDVQADNSLLLAGS